MIELFVLVPVVVLCGYWIVTLFRKQRQARRAMITELQARGWHWLEQIPDVAANGSAAALPVWLNPPNISALRVRSIHQAHYSDYFCGTTRSLPLCGFNRTVRRHRGKDEGHYSTWQALWDAQQPEDFPEFFLVRSHGLTNALAALDDRIAALEGNDYRLRQDVPGFANWRVHATPAGLDWLSSDTGARLARGLDHFDAIAQHAFGVSGQVVLAQGMSGSIEQIDAVTKDLLKFREYLQQALAAPEERPRQVVS